MNTDLRNDVYLFTDNDIDGAGCYYILRKLLGKNFPHCTTSERKFPEVFTQLENKESYKKIYICDLSVLEKHYNLIDLANVVYINHRNVEKYFNLPTKNLRQESENHTSCTLLLYKKLKESFKVPFSKEEKILIALINDYDNYDLQFSDSIKLHYLFSSYEGDKLEKFYNIFENGFSGFNETQINKIKNIEDKIQSTIRSLKVFKGDVKLGKNAVSLCSTFNSYFPSEICSALLTKYNCDIALSVNLNTEHISIRKQKKCPVNLGNFAKKIFEGGGDDCVAGGKITNHFLELSKSLYPVC